MNSRSWWWTGRPGVLQSMGSQRVRHDWATDISGAPARRLCPARRDSVVCLNPEKDPTQCFSVCPELSTHPTAWDIFDSIQTKPFYNYKPDLCFTWLYWQSFSQRWWNPDVLNTLASCLHCLPSLASIRPDAWAALGWLFSTCFLTDLNMCSIPEMCRKEMTMLLL